jgi:hypothetical protein
VVLPAPAWPYTNNFTPLADKLPVDFKLIAIWLSFFFAPPSGNQFEVCLHHKPKIRYSASTSANIFSKVQIMMTVEQIKKRLEDANLKRVAENAGVHPATVYRFMQEESKPLYETVKALSDYLSRQEATING